ncbi:MAG TPA: 4'-phosphopantetheinyl transferase superfamily protein [Streptosporangiaceae bacterium]|nr:4'-phosphopantetheinyl transferase superfamily protein [Streptosporangiaceae bacterium]
MDTCRAESTWGPLTLPQPGDLPKAGVCHLWSAPTTGAASHQALLTPGEREAAERFRVAKAKDAFVASKAAQRQVLGRYLGCAPEAVTIGRVCRHCGKDHGRPYVAGAPVDFSVSHSAGWLLVAVVANGLVGVDLELVSGDRAVDELANRVLAPAEQEQFLMVPRDQRPGWFIWAWARKEAALKLTGHGIAGPLSSLNVTGPTANVSPPPSGWPAEPIHLRDVPAPPDLRAALATTVPLSTVLMCGPALGM